MDIIKSNKNVKIYVWADENAWSDNKTKDIIQSFSPLKAKKHKKAAIGAGASGPHPELNILIEFAKQNYKKFLVEGFIKAVGSETLKQIIAGLKKASRIKPESQDLSDYGLGYKVTSADLILYVQVGDKEILVTIVLKEPKDYDNAFEKLPNALDKAFRSKEDFGRLYWIDGKWKAI